MEFSQLEKFQKCPDAADVARATDYIVAYACKGVETLQEEKRQMVALVMQAKEGLGDKTDVQRLARQLLNKTIGEKMILKQEAMVLISQLHLVECSESINTVSISGHYKLEKGRQNTTFLAKYAHRPDSLHHLSLHQYFHYVKNPKQKVLRRTTVNIPHYVGASSYPVYPPTSNFARSIVLLHVPWHSKFDNKQNFLQLFHDALSMGTLPDPVFIPYKRIKARYDARVAFKEPTNSQNDPISPFLSANMTDDIKDIILLSNMLPAKSIHGLDQEDYTFNYGDNYDWHTQHYHSCDPVEASTFLRKA